MNDIAMPLLFALDDVVNKYNELLKELNREDRIQSMSKYVFPYVQGSKMPDLNRINKVKNELMTEFMNVVVEASLRDKSRDF